MKLLRAFSFLLLAFLQVQTASTQSASSVKKIMQSIDTAIERTMKEGGIVGIGAAIIVDKKLVWSKGYGYADKEQRKPFTVNTIMNIGSIAKNFTGVCLMKAVEENKLSLDADINTYLPFKVINPYFPKEKITLRQMATHTSSLTDRYPIYDSSYLYGAGDPKVALGQFLRDYFDVNGKYYAKENFLPHPPRTYYEYSNLPAALAGYIVELLTGQKLPELGKNLIFQPLGMKSSGWSMSAVNMAHHTKLYRRRGDTLTVIPLYSVITYPEGGVRTNVTELARYFITLLNEGESNGVRILKKESVREMQRFQFSESHKPSNVDLKKLNSGIFWATKQSVTQVGHAGTDPGIIVEMLTDLSKEVGIILFTNTDLEIKPLIKYHFGIFDLLRKYGLELKAAKTEEQN